MVALFVTIDILEIGKHKLNINEYLTLLKFQHDSEGRSFPFDPDPRFYPRLVEDGFIEILSSELVKDKMIYTCILGPEGKKLFEGDEDLFEEFYKTFPHKVPTDMGFRPVSAASVDSQSAKATRSIWDRVTKNKPHIQKKIIENLKRELNYRKAEGSLAYLQGIDTWLRQATWEKWDDIPDKKDSSSKYIQL